MRVFRPARENDLLTIYRLQNVPFREEVFDSALPPYEDFFSEKVQGLNEKREYYYLLEKEEKPEGFAWFVKSSDFWHTTLWGRWIKTLVFAAGTVAFEHLGFPRVIFGVRQSNKRMNRICEQFRFRKVGETSAFVTSEQPPYLRVALLNYYDITAEEFRERAEFMRRQSLTLTFTRIE